MAGPAQSEQNVTKKLAYKCCVICLYVVILWLNLDKIKTGKLTSSAMTVFEEISCMVKMYRESILNAKGCFIFSIKSTNITYSKSVCLTK